MSIYIFNAFNVSGAPGTIRTCDPLIRSQVLYPAELRVHEMRFTLPAISWQEAILNYSIRNN